jgi:hypothetical protein
MSSRIAASVSAIYLQYVTSVLNGQNGNALEGIVESIWLGKPEQPIREKADAFGRQVLVRVHPG